MFPSEEQNKSPNLALIKNRTLPNIYTYCLMKKSKYHHKDTHGGRRENRYLDIIRKTTHDQNGNPKRQRV